jgi:hypothetical protein
MADREREPRATVGAPLDGERLQSAWAGTVSDVAAMAERRRETGWEAVAIPCGELLPEHRAAGESDRFGLVFSVPEDYVVRFQELFRRGSFPEYEVFQRAIEGRVFLAVAYRDPEAELAILSAGQFARTAAARMVADAAAVGDFFTHHRGADGERLGSFHHDGHERFVPRAAELAATVED